MISDKHAAQVRAIAEQIEALAVDAIDSAPTVEEAMMYWGAILGLFQAELQRANERICNPKP